MCDSSCNGFPGLVNKDQRFAWIDDFAHVDVKATVGQKMTNHQEAGAWLEAELIIEVDRDISQRSGLFSQCIDDN
jgi:hypothetical protein